MKDIDARPVKVDGRYRIEITIDGDTQFIGRAIDDILFKWVEFDAEIEAIKYIEKSERLKLA